MQAVSITMSNKFDSPEKVKIATLIHEMIHISDYTFNPAILSETGEKYQEEVTMRTAMCTLFHK